MAVDKIVNKLNDFIFDEDKLVTYAWLSKQLGIHVNISKQVLLEFWQNNKTKAHITATFAIMGQLTDGSERIEVVEESALNLTKEKFQKIFSEHIYSLQKTLSDLQMLALSEPYTKFTSINCKESYLKPVDNRSNSQSLSKTVQEKKTSPVKINIKSSEKDLNSKVLEQKDVETTVSLSTDGNKEKVNGTAGIKEKKKKAVEKVPKKPVQSLEAGFKSMFGKVSDSNSKHLAAQKEVKEIEKTEERKTNRLSAFEKKDDDAEEETKTVKEKIRTPTKVSKKDKESDVKTTQRTSKNSKKKKTEKTGKTNVAVKKRKRIISESDSSDNSASSDAEEETKENTWENAYVGDAEEPKISPSSPEINENSGKRIVKTMEDVRFLDEDGFLVTKKVTVATEVKEEATDKHPPSSKPSKEVNVNKKQTKQSTLTSFFKKK